MWSNTGNASYASYNSTSSMNANKKDYNYKRERFNSEGNTNKYAGNPQVNNKYEEIEIDVTNLKYSLNGTR